MVNHYLAKFELSVFTLVGSLTFIGIELCKTETAEKVAESIE